MPLISIPGEQAFANIRANKTSVWPDGRKDRERLSGVARVEFRPSFEFEPGERVFTVGSCFARNVEQRLSELGFDLPACGFSLPAEERASDTENDFLNKYPPHAILNEFRWALDPDASFPEAGLLQLRGDNWHDPHAAPNLKPAKRVRVQERREMVTSLYRQIPQCRLIVMTLGLVEAWFDQIAGVYLNGAPPTPALQANPGRFRLDVLSPVEVHGALVEIYDLLIRFGHPDFRMLLTVSPVPMRTTFTGEDAIVANSYSKSALRAAAQMFVLGRDRVDYFPSYEIVTLTNRSAAYIQDNRHVTPQLVNTIVDGVVEAYCPAAAEASRQTERVGAKRVVGEIRKALKEGDYERACALYGPLETRDRYTRAGFDKSTFRYEYGKTLLRIGSTAEAQIQLSRVVEIDPGSAQARYQLARALARLQRPLEAVDSFRRAVEIDPGSAELRLAYANQLSELGRDKEAEDEALAVLKGNADNSRAAELIEALRGRRGQVRRGETV